jgi:predicted RNase H-like HicB family nuclease
MQMTARIWPEEGGFVAVCVEVKVVSEGDTEQEALTNLQEAVAGFLECADPSEVRERMHAGDERAGGSTGEGAAGARRSTSRSPRQGR